MSQGKGGRIVFQKNKKKQIKFPIKWKIALIKLQKKHQTICRSIDQPQRKSLRIVRKNTTTTPSAGTNHQLIYSPKSFNS
jgi:hypothetical protein